MAGMTGHYSWVEATLRLLQPQHIHHRIEPGLLPRAHSAALSAPRAKIMRSSALCTSSMRSAAPAKIT